MSTPQANPAFAGPAGSAPLHDLCGACAGECCKYISIPLAKIAGLLPRLDIPWLQARGTLYQDGTWRIPSRCPHLTDAGRCGIYASRPESCRTYEVDGPSCRRARAVAAGMPSPKPTRPPTCCWCGDAATCVGRYEDEVEDRYCCDDHCGHGNEDGHCRKLSPPPNQDSTTLVAERHDRHRTNRVPRTH